MRALRRILSGLVLLSVCVVSLYVGTRYGVYFERHRLMFGLSERDNVRLSLRRLTGIIRARAQLDQDLWVMLAAAPGKKNGFYVDVGSADGERISNTKMLDELGWKGVCVEPFPTNMQARTCQLFRQPVFREGGQKVRFRSTGDLGGIETDLGSYKGITSQAPVVELVTATLDEILAKAHAPNYIDYMSIDVEGAEYDALLGLSLDKYEVGAFTIEHNFEQNKREFIRKLLESKGYVRVKAWSVDDFYVAGRFASRFPPAERYSWCLY